jgi:hypothetical protein
LTGMPACAMRLSIAPALPPPTGRRRYFCIGSALMHRASPSSTSVVRH